MEEDSLETGSIEDKIAKEHISIQMERRESEFGMMGR